MQISLKRLIVLAAVFLFFGCFIETQTSQAQQSPVERGYYDEGYQDGINDAQAGRKNDYKRYKNKFDKRYESIYKQGYQTGYDYIRPNIKWTSDQKKTYDKGYGYGRDDNKKSISRLPERYEGKYDNRYADYYRKGYYDGYDGLNKQYDTRVDDTGYPTYPNFPNNSTYNNIFWTGRVDDRVNISITGATVQSVAVSGSEVSRVDYRLNNTLPRRAVNVSVRKTKGRGDVFVVQQPNRDNNYTAIVQVNDSKGGASDYQLEVGWETSKVEEPYQPGRVYWSGRVDNKVHVIIEGDYVRSIDMAGTGMSNVNFNLTGYLARRNGNVITARKLRGRGSVQVIQQPSWDNDFTTIVQILDPDRSSDDYQIEISW